MRAWLVIASVAVLVAVAAAAGGASATSSVVVKSVTFADARGEDPEAPDVTRVVVSNGAAVWQLDGRPLRRPSRVVTFRIDVSNRAALTEDMRIALWIDADDDPATGLTGEVPLPGADYLVNWDRKQRNDASLLRCRPGICSTVTESLLRASYANGATFSILASELGGTTGFRFAALASSGIVYGADGNLDLTNAGLDRAPESASWRYVLPLRPERLLVETFSSVPSAPRAGSAFVVQLSARRDDTGALVASGRIRCSASVGARPVAVRSRSFVGARATCVLAIPRDAAGQRLRGSITLSSAGATVTRTFSTAIR